MSRVSVIIPCYNQGHFLAESVGSVLQQTYTDIEIIIVNDGSDDQETCLLFATLARDNVTIIHTSNQGLAAARNNGILAASGEYILPLDADDRIDHTYIQKAVEIMESDPAIGIVYSRSQLFGGIDAEWPLPEFCIEEMVKDNIIFCSALFRRSDWDLVGGYDSQMIYGWEDYDFWLSLIEKGRKVYRIPELLFYYRVETDSMVRSKDISQKVQMFSRIYRKHRDLFSDNIEVWLETMLSNKETYYTSRLYIDTGDGISDAGSISRKVDTTTTLIQFRLEDIEGIRNVRFDPVDVPAVVDLQSIICEFSDGRKKQITDFCNNALFRKESDLFFDTYDSQCLFSLTDEELNSLASISIRLRFKALEAAALSLIIEEMKTLERGKKKKSGLRQFIDRVCRGES